jgi:predicted nucleic acid-binding protein
MANEEAVPLRIYLDTSVLGAGLDDESSSRVEITGRLFSWIVTRGHVACISAVTRKEIDAAPNRVREHIRGVLSTLDLEVLGETDESIELARAYIEKEALGANAIDDARHLAVAAVHGVDVVVSWNFRHMVNYFKRQRVHAINLEFGWPQVGIVAPAELLEEGQEDD